MYLAIKALHIISVVAWFAGLFYIVRLFVYLGETQRRTANERAVLEPQLRLMARRLWFGITWPAGVASTVMGGWLLTYHWPPQPWLIAKGGLIGLLFAYHMSCHLYHARFQAGRTAPSPRFFRVWNEVATLLLVSIVFVAVLKSTLSIAYAVSGLGALTVLLLAGIEAYRRARIRATGE